MLSEDEVLAVGSATRKVPESSNAITSLIVFRVVSSFNNSRFSQAFSIMDCKLFMDFEF